MNAGGTGSAQKVIAELTRAGAGLATAESLTGGQLAARITSVPGASVAYLGGVVSYATEIKIAVLGVGADLVAEHGVVSAQCAEAMAAGVRRLLGSQWAVATTGVAGPDTQEGKPVGTVYIAVAGPDDVRRVRALQLSGPRPAIQSQSVDAALDLIGEAIGVRLRPEEPGLR